MLRIQTGIRALSFSSAVHRQVLVDHLELQRRPNESFRIEVAEKSDIPEVNRFMQQFFQTEEPLCKTLGIRHDNRTTAFIEELVTNGINSGPYTLMAYSGSELVSMIVNTKLKVKHGFFPKPNGGVEDIGSAVDDLCEEMKISRPLGRLIAMLDSACLASKSLVPEGVKHLMHNEFGVSRPDYYGCGLMTWMMKESVRLANEVDGIFDGICTAPETYTISKTLNAKLVYVLPFSKVIDHGTALFPTGKTVAGNDGIYVTHIR